MTAARTLEGHTSEVWGATISPDSQKIATANRDGTVKLWSRNGQLQRTIVIASQSGLTRLTFTQDGRYLTVHRDLEVSPSLCRRF